MMYVQGARKDNVQDWVDAVRDLRYKDYQLVAHIDRCESTIVEGNVHGLLEEVSTVKEMGSRLGKAGLEEWWRKAMGWTAD